MADVDRLKRQMLRDLVEENLDLIHGNLPRRKPRRRDLRMALGVLVTALVSLGLFGSARLVSSHRPGSAPPPIATSRIASAASPAAPLGPAAAEAAPVLSAPTPVDAAVFPLAVRKIVIDPGHGGTSVGTRAPLGLVEKDLTLDIADRLHRLLEAQGFQVRMTRERDEGVSLAERGAIANRAGGDLFISIHLNWIEDRKTRGVETYYLGATDDPYLTRLAAAENRDSGYSLADMRGLLDRIYAGVRQDKSRKLAETVQSSLFHSLGRVNPQVEDRGVKAAPFIVLLTTEMPAILAEVSCLSNDEEAQNLSKPLYRQYIAEALASGVRSYADAVEGKPAEAPASGTGVKKGI
jgi:N-acetylmuramoyl-L-alanine amidase